MAFMFELRDRVMMADGREGVVIARTENLAHVQVQIAGTQSVPTDSPEATENWLRQPPPALPDPDGPPQFAMELVDAENSYTVLHEPEAGVYLEAERAESALALVAGDG